MIEELKEGQNIVIEGRLRMNSVTRKDGTKEKQAELTASKIHQITEIEEENSFKEQLNSTNKKEDDPTNKDSENSEWNSSPLVPEIDEIPF